MRFQRLSTFVSATLAVVLLTVAGVSAAAAANIYLVYEARGHVITVEDAVVAAGWGQNVAFLRGGSDLPGSALLATGDEVYADTSDGSGSTYTVIVRGDLCGSGKPGITQLAAVAAALKNPEALDTVHRYAADLDESGTIGLADLVLAARYMMQPNADGPVYPNLPEVGKAAVITVSTGGTSFQAVLADTQAAREFEAMLELGPVTIGVSEYGGFEMVGTLGTCLTASNERITTKPGDIMLYNGSNIVLFYGSNTWEYTPIAAVENRAGWKDALRSGAEVVFSLGSTGAQNSD